MSAHHPSSVLAGHYFNTAIKINGKNRWVSRPNISLPIEKRKDWIGSVGVRANFFLKLIEIRGTSRGYDVYLFEDEVGNSFVAFTNGLCAKDTDLALERGVCYIVKATIKRHAKDEYNHDVRPLAHYTGLITSPPYSNQNHIKSVLVLNAMGKKE